MDLKNKRIFIIEDNNFNLSIALTILERAGAVVEFDRWGVDAIERLYKFKPIDVILLDLMFPKGVTGYDVFTEIHNHPDFAHIPVIAVSAVDPSDAVPRLQKLGFAGFIRKPVNFMNLPHLIASVLEGEEVWVW